MGEWTEEMRARLPAGLTLPEPLAALFEWIEAHNLLHPSQRFAGDRFGTLQPLDPPSPGTILLFRVETPEQAGESARWLGDDADGSALGRRLVPFARTGGDGSHAAFWLDDDGAQHIVHLGSEGLACELGRTPLEFLRLCAIGYSELSGEMMDAPDQPPSARDALNAPFVEWLVSSFGVTVPATATEIIDIPPRYDATDSPDPFWRWVRDRTPA